MGEKSKVEAIQTDLDKREKINGGKDDAIHEVVLGEQIMHIPGRSKIGRMSSIRKRLRKCHLYYCLFMVHTLYLTYDL